MATIGTLLIELSANVARLENDLGRASMHVRNTERMMKQSVDRMNGFFSLLGVTLSGAAVVGYSKHLIDAADATNDLAQRHGLAVEEIVGLQHAAQQSSTDIDKLASASNKLGGALSDKPELFKKLGIDATTGMGAMVQLADTFQSMPDGIQKNELAAKLFGDRLGSEMIPFLNQGTEAIKGLIAEGQRLNPLTTKQAEEAAKLNDQLDKLGFQAKGAGMQIMSVLVPGLTDASTKMHELAANGHPVLALWQGLAGMGKVPWDLLFPPEDLKKSLSVDNQIKDYKAQLRDLHAELKNPYTDSFLGRGTEAVQKDIDRIKNLIATLEKHRAELDKPNNPKPQPPAKKSNIPDDLFGKKGSVDGMQVLKALELDYQNTLSRRAEAMNYPLMSASERALAEDMRGVHDSAAKSRVELEKLNVAGKLSAADYSARLKELEAQENAQVEAIKRMAAAQDKLNDSWQFGASVAVRKYLDEVGAGAKQTERLITTAFNSMESSLANFYRGGTLSLDAFKNAVLDMMAQIAAQRTILQLTNLFGGIGGGAAGGGGASLTSSPSIGYNPSIVDSIIANGGTYEGGGYTGPGPRSGGVDGRGGFPAILHPDETVVDHTRPSSASPAGQMPGSGGQQIVINDYTTINVDSRSDRAQAMSDIDRLIDAKQNRLIDRLRRDGAIA
jgi:hypothetical protein